MTAETSREAGDELARELAAARMSRGPRPGQPLSYRAMARTRRLPPKTTAHAYETGERVLSQAAVPDYAAFFALDADHLEELRERAQEEEDFERQINQPTHDEELPAARPRRRTLAITVAVALVVVLAAVSVTVKEVAGGYGTAGTSVYAKNDGAVTLRSCPATTCAELDTLGTGAAVRMICLHDAATSTNLNYSSPRWFDVRVTADGRTGWIHSSQVHDQTRSAPAEGSPAGRGHPPRSRRAVATRERGWAGAVGVAPRTDGR